MLQGYTESIAYSLIPVLSVTARINLIAVR